MSGNRLLVIDDERPFGEFVRKVGIRVGYEVKSTDQVTEFEQQIKTWKPTLILVDLQMPDVDGIEVLRRVRELGSTTKVMLASGMDRRTLEAAARVGAGFGLDVVGHIKKPIRAAQLQVILRDLLDPSTEIAETSLRRAIDQDELFLVYQPKYDLTTNQTTGVEALLRWREPTNDTILYPDTFIPLAEEVGLIDSVTNFVIEKALRQASEWIRQGLNLKVSVNVSATNLHDLVLPDTWQSMCRDFSVPSETLILELTETAAMRDAATISDILTRCRIKGFGLSIDDFGTGYSSLIQLQRLPFSELKIDRIFVMNIDTSTDSLVIANTIIDMAKNLEMQVTAEGLENATGQELLREMGCDLAQGYFYSRPLEGEKIPDFVRKAESNSAEIHTD